MTDSTIEKPQRVVVQNDHGRIVTMDSMTYADARNFNCDVLVAASYFGQMPVRHWLLPLSPKGVIAHAAGIGKNEAGISGLGALEAVGVPGAAAATDSCRISDGTDLYENGRIGHMNGAAEAIGITVGMSVADAANRMLERIRETFEPAPDIETMYTGSAGRIIAMGSVSFIDAGNRDDVICGGSNFSIASAGYSTRFTVRGVICNDAGGGKDDAGIAGLSLAAERGLAAAAVSANSAEIGSGISTYRDGIISAVNTLARNLGVRNGMTAAQAALLLLEKTQ